MLREANSLLALVQVHFPKGLCIPFILLVFLQAESDKIKHIHQMYNESDGKMCRTLLVNTVEADGLTIKCLSRGRIPCFEMLGE